MSHTVVFIVDGRCPYIIQGYQYVSISHKQIKMSFDAPKKKNKHNQRKPNKSPQPSHQTQSTHQREGKSVFLKKAVCSDLCKCEVLLPIFNQFVHLIKIIWNTIKCRPENLFNIDHLTESEPGLWTLHILSSKSAANNNLNLIDHGKQ